MGRLWPRSVGRCGKLDHYVCFGQCGKQEKELPLREKCSLSKG